MMLTLYHNRGAVCAQKVRLALAEKRLEWRGVEVDFANTAFMEMYRRELNPQGVVPTLLVGAVPLVESNVILQWLEESFPAVRLIPADPIERARMRVWLSQIDIDIHTAINALSFAIVFRHNFRAMPPERLQAAYAAIVGAEKRWRRQELVEKGLDSRLVGFAVERFVRLFADMEHTLEHHAYLMGGEYTIADLALTPYIERLIALGFGPVVAEYPGLTHWWGLIVSRANYKQAILDWGGAATRAEFEPAAQQAWGQILAMVRAVAA
jgi:glutathione S-transferase